MQKSDTWEQIRLAKWNKLWTLDMLLGTECRKQRLPYTLQRASVSRRLSQAHHWGALHSRLCKAGRIHQGGIQSLLVLGFWSRCNLSAPYSPFYSWTGPVDEGSALNLWVTHRSTIWLPKTVYEVSGDQNIIGVALVWVTKICRDFGFMTAWNTAVVCGIFVNAVMTRF